MTAEGFTFRATKDGRVRIFHHGRAAATLKGRPATSFLGRIGSLDAEGQQRLMAKVTGQYRFGNERSGGPA